MKKWSFLILSLTVGCGSSDAAVSPISYPQLDCDPMVPEFCGFPFPSNVYTVADSDTPTGRRVLFGDEFLRGNRSGPWDLSDGFSAGTPILTYLAGATGEELARSTDIDASLAEDSPTIVIEAESGERVPHFAEIDVRGQTEEERAIHIRPVVRLKDNTRYIAAIRNVRDSAGDLIEPSAVFAALRDQTDNDDPSVASRRVLYADIFAKLDDAGVEREEVQIAWDFNTASDANNTQWMLKMRDEALDMVGAQGPEFTIDTVEDDYDTDNIAFRIFGTFRVPLYMTTSEIGATMVLDDENMPMINPDQPWADVPFEVLIPQSALESPASLIQYGHGLFGQMTQIQSGHFRTFMNEYNYIFFATDLQGMSELDALIAGGALSSGEFADAQTIFDRLHQGILNSLLLMRMMKGRFATDSDYSDYIDPTKAYYYGISQGGIMGSVYLALSTDVERGALGVMGQPYSLLLLRSVDFTPFLDLLKINHPDPRFHLLFTGIAQMLWDRVEPTGYTHHITRDPLPGTEAKEVLMRSAIGDHQVTTLAAHIMARTLDAVHLDSGLRDIWSCVSVESTDEGNFYIENDFGLPGEPWCGVPMSLCGDPHEHVRRTEASRRQLDEFLREGTGTNHCPDGLCSYPELSGCEEGEDAEALDALCQLPDS